MSDPTTVFLVRHGHTDWIGNRIAGRTPGAHLNDKGRAQAARLVDRMRHLPLGAIYSSPLERAAGDGCAAREGARMRGADVPGGRGARFR